MPVAQTDYWTARTVEVVQRMGFNIARLRFYKWLVEQDRSPEFDGAETTRQLAAPVAVYAGR